MTTTTLPAQADGQDTPNGHGHVEVGADTLTVAEVARIARADARTAPRIAVGEAARTTMSAGVKCRDEWLATGRPIYGVTTGFGANANVQLGPAHAAELQRNLITYHLNGTGPSADRAVVRATLLIRANCLARGISGVRAEIIDLLIGCLEHDILPLIPERGSVGASGDLVPLCYLASALIGDGEVTFAGETVPASRALRACGLTPVRLEPKEGLALINGTSFMAGFAALAADAAGALSAVADLCTALAAEALRANRDHFHPFLHRQKPHPGQIRSAERIRALLTGSRSCRDNTTALPVNPHIDEHGFTVLPEPVQDRYSIRCAPHVTGVLLDTLDWVVSWLDIEINSTNDNPLFDPASGGVFNGGNFYGGHVGQAMDALKLAVASVGDMLDRQLALLVDANFNRGLPANLVARPEAADPGRGVHHGFKGMQIASSALAAEALKLTNPATAFSRSTEAHNQDKVSMGTIAARDARTVAELVNEIAAIHLIAACQAAQLRGTHLLGAATRACFELIREHTAFLDRDRRLDGDVSRVVALITSGTLPDAINALCAGADSGLS